MVSGNQWRDEEVAHTLRLLEIIGRTDIPVVPGRRFPAGAPRVKKRRCGSSATAKWPSPAPGTNAGGTSLLSSRRCRKASPRPSPPTKTPSHFLIRKVRKFPHEVTIYEGGPMTNLALAISIDPQFPELAQELVFMGGSLAPQTDDPEFVSNPRHEFNFWFDPEAAQIVLRAPWKKIVCTPTDISVKTRLTPAMIKQIDASGTPLARYVARFYQTGQGGEYMWDELAAAAWIDPTLITRRETRYMSGRP